MPEQATQNTNTNSNAQAGQGIENLLETLSSENVGKLLETDAFQKLISPYVDRKVNAAVKTNMANRDKYWTEERLPKEVEALYLQQHPEDKPEVRAAKQAMQKTKELEDLLKLREVETEAIQYANTKNLGELAPWIKTFMRGDQKNSDSIYQLIDNFGEFIQKVKKDSAEKAIGANSPKMTGGDDKSRFSQASLEELERMYRQDRTIGENKDWVKRYYELKGK